MKGLCFYQRTAVLLVALFAVLLSVVYFTSDHLQSITRNEAEQRLHIGLAEHLVQDNPLLKTGVYDYDALKNLFHTMMVIGPSFEFYYLDPQGNILTYSAETGKVKSESVSIEPIQALISNPEDLPLKGDDPRNPGTQKIFSVAPVEDNGQLQGYLYVIIGGEMYDSVFANINANTELRQLAITAAVLLVALLVVMLVLFRLLTSPLKRLTEDMASVQRNDYRPSEIREIFTGWKRGSRDEVQRLGCAFQDMLKHIDGQFEQLQQQDMQRRVMLADLSHDLRTPLASLHGYMETLSLKGDSMDEADRARFVDISLKNAQNLKHLIDQIFELAYLEGGQVTLNQESFPLGELLYDIAAKFELKTLNKDITLVVLPNQFEYQVFADVGKLERVMTNLLENAVRYTPKGGQITLQVTPLEDKIRVDIRDTGVGIQESEIAHIFDARYQATNQVKDHQSHGGLGLAISKKLVALFKSDLRVQSKIGEGTCFSFELPTSPVSA